MITKTHPAMVDGYRGAMPDVNMPAVLIEGSLEELVSTVPGR